jgi:hypothetical protein
VEVAFRDETDEPPESGPLVTNRRTEPLAYIDPIAIRIGEYESSLSITPVGKPVYDLHTRG